MSGRRRRREIRGHLSSGGESPIWSNSWSDAGLVELPELHPAAMQKIDRLDASFWAAVNTSAGGPDGFTRMERQRVKVWLDTSFDRLAKLGDLV
jgi:hypothetical protein